MANIRHNNLVGEIKGISDSLTTRQYYKDLASLGRLSDDTKAEALNAFNNNNFTGPIKPGSYKGGFTRFNNIGPFADNEKFLDFVSGSAADKARASVGSDKKPQNIQKYMVSDGRIVSIDQNKNRKPGGPSTENVTGFTYEEIKKKSGEKTMQMAHTYFSRNKNKK